MRVVIFGVRQVAFHNDDIDLDLAVEEAGFARGYAPIGAEQINEMVEDELAGEGLVGEDYHQRIHAHAPHQLVKAIALSYA